MWMQHRADHIKPWWDQIKKIGFDRIEVSHIIRPEMLTGLIPGEIKITSVHFPAPRINHPTSPLRAEDLICSQDNQLRLWAVDQGKKSIDFAQKFGAKALCIHPGDVPIDRNLEWVLKQRFLGGYYGTPHYMSIFNEFMSSRNALIEPSLNAARKSLTELARYAEGSEIKLGIETRVHLFEIPSLNDAERILQEHDPEILGLWYDTGHVQIVENLGLDSHEAWLKNLGNRIIAIHLHDARGLRDHLPPGAGEIDFNLIAKNTPQDAPRVCEFDWYFEPEEVLAGVQYLAQKGCCSAIHQV